LTRTVDRPRRADPNAALTRTNQRWSMRAPGLRCRRTVAIKPGGDPRIYTVVDAPSTRSEGVDAHGSGPWAEGPRIKSGHEDSALH
jgi:hypothetical protein